jgi:hypothetical protein
MIGYPINIRSASYCVSHCAISAVATNDAANGPAKFLMWLFMMVFYGASISSLLGISSWNVTLAT